MSRLCVVLVRCRMLMLLIGSLLVPKLLIAQNAQPAVTLVATGPTPAAQALSRQLLMGIQNQLRNQKKVNPRGDVLVAARSDVSQVRLFDYMKANEAGASVLLDFVPEEGSGFGFAHLTVSSPTTASAAAGLPAPGRGRGADIAPDRTPATSRTISDYLNPSAVKPWQFENFAAFITERVSGGREIRVQLWVYITPRGSIFSVGGSDPTAASDPGRSENEGFRYWVGTRPQGITTVEVSNMPDYSSARRQITVPNNPDRKFEGTVQVVLERRP